MENIKQISVKNQIYYFYNDMIIEHFHPTQIKIDKESYKDISIYNIG